MSPLETNTGCRVENARQRPGKIVAEPYLYFTLAGEHYAVDRKSVTGIRDWAPVVSIPGSPTFVKGVVIETDLVLPIIDLRFVFGLVPRNNDHSSRVLVIKTHHRGRDSVLGIQVDEVEGLFMADGQDIKQAPEFGGERRRNFVTGTCLIDGREVLLINIHDLHLRKELH